MAAPKNGTHSEATVMADGKSTVTITDSLLKDLLSEMRESRNLLSKINEDMKDNNKKILSRMEKSEDLLSKINGNTKDIPEMARPIKRNDSEPVKVFIRTSFVSVGDIDAVKQEFKCEFYLSVKWKEPALEGYDNLKNLKNLSPELKDNTDDDFIEWENYWDPNVYILDAVSYDIHEKEQKLLKSKDPSDGVPYVLQYFHIKGTFKEVLEVNDFPFDYQDLQIVLTSRRETKHIELWKDEDRDDNIRTWNFTAKQEWDLQKHVITKRGKKIPEEGTSEYIFPFYTVQLHVRRRYGFYIYNIAFLMFLITALTFTTFAVEADAIADRVQITLTLLLTSVAFKYYVQQFLPTVSYLTFLGKYILSCMLFQFGIAAIHDTVSGLLTSKKSIEIFEAACFEVGLLVFLVVNIVFIALSFVKVWKANKKAKKHRRKYMKYNKSVKARYFNEKEDEETEDEKTDDEEIPLYTTFMKDNKSVNAPYEEKEDEEKADEEKEDEEIPSGSSLFLRNPLGFLVNKEGYMKLPNK